MSSSNHCLIVHPENMHDKFTPTPEKPVPSAGFGRFVYIGT
jgi:hypothetical protein